MDTGESHPICLGLTEQGAPCKMRTRTGRDYCINHDPDYRDEVQASRALGAQRAAEARRERTFDLENLPIDLSRRASIQAALDLIVRLTLAGQITEGRSRQVLRALSLAIRNFDTVTDYGRVYHDPSRYTSARDRLLDPDAPPAPAEPPADPAAVRALAELNSSVEMLLASRKR